jgi:hypothetical protein
MIFGKLKSAPVITPPQMLSPPGFCLWYPLADNTGTPTAGHTSVNALNVNGIGIITKTAVVGVNAAGSSYVSTGGILHASGSAAYWDIVPSGDELSLLQANLDMSTLVEGQTIIIGCEFITPAGWAAAHTSSNTIFSFGTLTSGSVSGGADFGVSSVERPQVLVWGKDATAQTVVTPTGGFVLDSERNCIVWEVTCTAPNTFKTRSHVVNSTGGTSSDWTTPADWSNPASSGTAAPSCGTVGIRLARRNGSTTNQTNRGEVIRNVWLATINEETTGVAYRSCLELQAFPNQLPRIIRNYIGDPTIFTGPDGNANKTFGDILPEDMFVYLDGATAFADHPEISLEVEQPASPTVTKLSTIATHTKYVSDANVEGLEKVNPAYGTYKFARMKTGAFANSVLFSAHKSDISNRGRSEITWQGAPVTLPYGVKLWTAFRVYFDFDPPDVGQLIFHQLYPGYSGTGMFPPFVLKLDTTNKAFKCEFRWAPEENTLPEHMVLEELDMPGYSSAIFGTWLDFVIEQNLNWDESQNPYTRVYVGGILALERLGPVGYRGPSGQNGKSLAPFTRCGIYPPSPYITPNTKRDFYFSRFFVSKDSGAYNVNTLREALTA